MNKKSSLLVLFIIIGLLFGIYYLKGSEKKVVNSIRKVISPKLKKEKVFLSSSAKKLRVVSKNEKKKQMNASEKKDENFNGLIAEVKNDILSCQNKMNELFGAVDVEVNFKLYTDFEILDSFKKFNKIDFNSEKTGVLLKYIANEEKDFSKQEMEQLEVIAPCRVFQKINFLDEVKRRLAQSQNSAFKQELITELRAFFEKEVSTSSSVASLTMALNMIESFSDSTGLQFSKSEQEKIDQVIDDMEVDYEKMLNSVEEELSSDADTDNQELSRTLVRSEIELNKKYKNRILDLFSNRKVPK